MSLLAKLICLFIQRECLVRTNCDFSDFSASRCIEWQDFVDLSWCEDLSRVCSINSKSSLQLGSNTLQSLESSFLGMIENSEFNLVDVDKALILDCLEPEMVGQHSCSLTFGNIGNFRPTRVTSTATAAVASITTSVTLATAVSVATFASALVAAISESAAATAVSAVATVAASAMLAFAVHLRFRLDFARVTSCVA